jgi:hypothetical protein
MSKWDLLLDEALKNKAINLNQFVTRCCCGLSVDPQQVIDFLLSADDQQAIICGGIAGEELRLHIELWVINGMPDYSGK